MSGLSARADANSLPGLTGRLTSADIAAIQTPARTYALYAAGPDRMPHPQPRQPVVCATVFYRGGRAVALAQGRSCQPPSQALPLRVTRTTMAPRARDAA